MGAISAIFIDYILTIFYDNAMQDVFNHCSKP